MMQNDGEDFIQALAKQAYRHELLVKALHARGILPPHEPDSLWNEEEFAGFLKIFRSYFSGKRRKKEESGESWPLAVRLGRTFPLCESRLRGLSDKVSKMRFNRSVPPCVVIPVLIYPDPGAAADWLSKAFGFAIRLRIANHRIQMKAGDGCITIAEGNVVPNHSHIIQVRIEDAKGHCERARQNGAVIVTEPQDQPYGERQYNAQDSYGHRWDFTETISDVAPEEWSGGAFHLE